jgi:hypothetical protein
MRALILAALLLGSPPAAAASGPDAASAKAFLQSIYQYYHKGGEGAPLEPTERWFVPALSKAIKDDMAESEKTGDVGKIDADFFCDCQDFEELKPVIGPVSITGGRATVSVSFVNGDPHTLKYTLGWTRYGWRVADIDWGEDGTLRELFFGGGYKS